jgi:prophage antirepressor-like protein
MDFWQTVAAISSVAAVVGAFLVWVSRKVLPAIRKVSRFIDRVSGVPADEEKGQHEVVGLFARMDQQDKKLEEQSKVLETIRHEVEFNNGSSVKDAVTRIEERLDAHLTPVPTTTINVNSGSTP